MYRAMLHVVLSSVATGLVFIAITSLSDISAIIAVVISVAVTSLIAVPITLIDTARTSNDVLGPFVRVQGAIRRLSYGDSVSKLAIRDGDIWKEWMLEFNAMLERVQSDERRDASFQYTPTDSPPQHVSDEMSVR